MAGHAVGRDAFLENEIIIPVSKLFDDPVDIARKNAHKVRLYWKDSVANGDWIGQRKG